MTTNLNADRVAGVLGLQFPNLKEEGYWRRSPCQDPDPQYADLPWPTMSTMGWDYAAFGRKLEALENSLTERHIARFRGFSVCRICRSPNGCADYAFSCDAIDGWVWPEGFRHYIEEHAVKPSDDFIKFVEGFFVQQTKAAEWSELVSANFTPLTGAVLTIEVIIAAIMRRKAEIKRRMSKGSPRAILFCKPHFIAMLHDPSLSRQFEKPPTRPADNGFVGTLLGYPVYTDARFSVDRGSRIHTSRLIYY